MLNRSPRKVLDTADRVLKAIAFTSGALAIAVAALNAGSESQNPTPTSSAPHASVQTDDAATAAANSTVMPTLAEVPIATKNSGASSTYVPFQPFNRDRILNDLDHKISDDFIIPPGLVDRVGFWFDIYSIYDSNKRVIHHSLYPWVVYKVVDVEPIINSEYPRFRWMRNEAADKLVKKELQKVRLTLAKLAKKKKWQLEDSRLSDDEIQVRNALLVLGGDVRRRAKEAAREVRIQMGQRNFMAEGLQTAPRYLEKMEEIFREQKLPVELTRLPLVESSFNKHATSKVGAVGIWQFMESTGRKKKLTINSLIDERKSPYKATEAAAKLLKENHMILGRSWELAITAWNHGPSGIKKAYRTAGTRDLSRIIELYHSRTFDFASENFFSEFLAALYTERYSNLIFPGLPKEPALHTAEVRLTRKMKVDEILSATELSAVEFATINPDMSKLLKKTRTLQRGLRILVPAGAKSSLEDVMLGRERVIGAND